MIIMSSLRTFPKLRLAIFLCTRLKLMKDQAKEVMTKTDQKSSAPKESKGKSRCRYENTGVCRRKDTSQDFHPRTTCQPHSKLGSCHAQAVCDHRHPHGICYDWQTYGSCFNGDGCRNRHPIELTQVPAQSFLVQGSPGGSRPDTQSRRQQPGQWSPSQIRHHDQRSAGRW